MFRPLMASVLVSALALACSDQQSPTASDNFAGPSLRATKDRFSAPTLTFFGNEQLTVGLGGTAEQWAELCATGETEGADVMTPLTITRPDGSQKFTLKGQNLDILVWEIPGSTPFGGDICADDPVYAGTGHLVITDSDVDLSHPGADAGGMSVVGTVTDASGQRYHLVVAIRFTVSEDTPDNFVIDVHVSKIQLTPIGH